jgi:hypothetical protein
MIPADPLGLDHSGRRGDRIRAEMFRRIGLEELLSPRIID